MYHVFTDDWDEWFGGREYKKAKALYDQWVRDFGNVKLYREEYATKHDFEVTMSCEELCLESAGSFPW